MGFKKVFTVSTMIIVFLVLFSSFSQAQQRVPDSACGRFQVFINPNVRADTFLVDMQTGKVWRMVTYTDVMGTPTIWQFMERIDSDQQLDKWLDQQILLKKKQ